jgi:hypothetical protein
MAANNLKKAIVGLRKELRSLPKDKQKRIAVFVKTIQKETGLEQLEKAFQLDKAFRRRKGFPFLPW